jgi:hypothetical protein
MISSDKKYFIRSEKVIEKKVGTDIALYVQDDRSIHVLNHTARFIWQCLKEPVTFDEILFVMHEVFIVEAETLRNDLKETLALFEEKNLIVGKDSDEDALS